MEMKRNANQDALKRTFASYHFGQLLRAVKEDPVLIYQDMNRLDDDTIQNIIEAAWDDWNFGSGDPAVLRLYEFLVYERNGRNRYRMKR